MPDATPPMKEGAFQTRVIGAARMYGWMAVHYRKSRTSSGRHVTAVQGDVGGPDLLLAKGGRVILAELKTDTGRYEKGQREWAEAIGPELYRLWRPRDWESVLVELQS